MSALWWPVTRQALNVPCRQARLQQCPAARLRNYLSPYRHRAFVTSTPTRTAVLAKHPPAECSVVIYSPSPEDIKQQDLDAEVISSGDIRIKITDSAAEQLRQIAAREADTQAALRIAVESGGCHGYQYKMELATRRQPDDYHLVHPTLTPSNILIDAVSMSLLNGSVVDFATELIGSSFRILDNPQAQGSGCGCGVSWELRV